VQADPFAAQVPHDVRARHAEMMGLRNSSDQCNEADCERNAGSPGNERSPAQLEFLERQPAGLLTAPVDTLSPRKGPR